MKAAPFYASVILLLSLNPTSCEEKPEHTFVRVDTLPTCTEDFTCYTDFVIANQFGLSVQNFRHHNIFRFASKKAPWKPINGYRATVGGRLDNYEVATKPHPEDLEYDWNLDVTPNDAFVPFVGSEVIAGEITPAVDLRENKIFPPQGKEGRSPLLEKTICMYGPWVRDKGNENRPEIHPAEAIWWQNKPGSNLDVGLMIIQDGSINRFTDFCHYDFDEDGDGVDDFQPGWMPWVEYPHIEEVKIPFQYDPRTLRYAVIKIEEVKSDIIVTAQYPELSDDADDGANHELKTSPPPNAPVFREETLVEVREGEDSNLGIQFTDVCKSTNGVITGNVRVLTAIGQPDTRAPGFIYLRFRISLATNRPQNIPG